MARTNCTELAFDFGWSWTPFYGGRAAVYGRESDVDDGPLLLSDVGAPCHALLDTKSRGNVEEVVELREAVSVE
eukprot:3434173-Rhodomonas_salina.1